MSDKVFLLGVGAQKCGTSWLHDVLTGSSQTDMGICKEYHIHDALTLPECARFRDKTLKQFQLLTDRGTPPEQNSKLAMRADFLSDLLAYYSYFQNRVLPDNITLTGDFTPSYSGLSARSLREINTQMQARGLQTKVVFLMRDPVERSWSALRMSRRKVVEKNPGHVSAEDEFRQLRRTYKTSSFELRAQYVETLERLEQVFAPQDIFIEFYERLFSQDVVDRLCDFAGIERVTADVRKHVNTSPKTRQIPQDLVAEIAQYHGDIYRQLAERFGVETILAFWSSARYVLKDTTYFKTRRA